MTRSLLNQEYSQFPKSFYDREIGAMEPVGETGIVIPALESGDPVDVGASGFPAWRNGDRTDTARPMSTGGTTSTACVAMATVNAVSADTPQSKSDAAVVSSNVPALPGVATTAIPRFTMTRTLTAALTGTSSPNAPNMHHRMAARRTHDTIDATMAAARR
jgi:hypothetical protein